MNPRKLKVPEIPKTPASGCERSLVKFLNQLRLRRILRIAMVHIRDCEGRPLVLDIGCGSGELSQAISQSCYIVAVDVLKGYLARSRAKRKNHSLDFVCADVNALPFVKNSFSLVLSASMLEHMLELDRTMVSLKEMLGAKGILVAGYPIETWLFKLVWRFLSPYEFKFIDQKQKLFVNPSTRRVENYWKNPTTHKQTYSTVRNALLRYFKVIRRVKLPFYLLPDLLSYYECVEAAQKCSKHARAK